MKKRALFMATAVLCLAGNIAAGQTKAETVSQEKQAYEYSKEDENGNTVIPANYMNFVYKDDILIIDDVLYDVNSLKVN